VGEVEDGFIDQRLSGQARGGKQKLFVRMKTGINARKDRRPAAVEPDVRV